MTIPKIIKGPHRFAGLWSVITECNGKIQHISRRTEQKTREIAVGQDSVTIH